MELATSRTPSKRACWLAAAIRSSTLSNRFRGLIKGRTRDARRGRRSEEHTSELQSQSNLLFPSFFFNEPATTEIYPLSVHDALPISAAIRSSTLSNRFRGLIKGRTRDARRGR